MAHIGINAHLLSGQAGYRSAGIHGYIYHTLAELAAAAPQDWRLTAMVGQAATQTFDGIQLRRSGLDTSSPLRRILWEQGAQPWQLGEFNLYHGTAFVSPLLLTKPSVITVYDLSFIHFPQVLSASRRLYLRLFTALSCRRARRVIAISQSTGHDLTSTFGIPTAKIDVAPPGYDASLYKPLSNEQVASFRQRKNLPERFWLFLGTLEPRKNLLMLLEAYAALPANERLPLVLAGGKGWDYQDIFSLVERYNLVGTVHFPGYVPADELPFWYNSSEVFLYPSIYEGFGIPVLEAMACGKPVIVSNASSLPEVSGSMGISLSPHDIPAWTQALKRAYSDDTWRAAAGQQSIQDASRFSWQATAQQTILSYQQALGQTNPKNKNAGRN